MKNVSGTFIGDKKFVTARQAAKLLDCAPAYVRKLSREGKLQSVVQGGQWLIEEDSIGRFDKERAKAKITRSQELSDERRLERSMLSAKVAAERLHCAPAYVRKLCREGKLASRNIDGTWFVEEFAIKRFEQQRLPQK